MDVISQANFYEHILGSVYWKDKGGVYLGANDHAAQMVGLQSSAELVGKTDYDLFDKEIADQYVLNDKKVLESGKGVSVEEKCIDIRGNVIYQLSSKKPLKNSEGEVIGIIGNTVDITYLKNIENELRTAKEKAEIANALKTQFIQNMQHDVRTPLARSSDPPPGNTVMWRGFSRLADIELGVSIGMKIVGN